MATIAPTAPEDKPFDDASTVSAVDAEEVPLEVGETVGASFGAVDAE